MLPAAVLLDSGTALSALRRTLPADHGGIKGCRTPAGLVRLVESSLVDVLVLGSKVRRAPAIAALRQKFPAIPMIIYGAFRTDDGPAILELEDSGAAAVLVEGVDDPIAGEVVARHGFGATFRAGLADLPRLLRLTEPLQQKAFEALARAVGSRVTAASIARKFRVSREHLSRQFAAGGAPNLKRFMDFLKLLAVRQLAVNPGYPAPMAARLTGYSSFRQLRAAAPRLVGLELESCLSAGTAELTRRFVTRGGRSRPVEG